MTKGHLVQIEQTHGLIFMYIMVSNRQISQVQCLSEAWAGVSMSCKTTININIFFLDIKSFVPKFYMRVQLIVISVFWFQVILQQI